MSLTIRQYPSQANVIRSHQWAYPTWYTVTSDVYTQSNFRYKFKLYTVDGLQSTSKNAPSITGGVGIYSPNKYLKNLLKLDGDFNPNITTWRTPKDQIIQYRIDVVEFGFTSPTPDSTSFQKNTIINCYKEDFNYKNYILGGVDGNGQGKALSKHKSTQTIKFDLESDEATIRFLCGKQRPDGTNNVNVGYNSLIYQIIVEVTKPDGTINIYTTNQIYPYYNQWVKTGLSNVNSILEDPTGMIIEFPSSPKLLNQVSWFWNSTISSGGVFIPVNSNIGVSAIISNGDTYKINAYHWPNGVQGKTSIDYNFSCNCRITNGYTPVQVSWLNELGGFDSFVFDLITTRNVSDNKQIYQQMRDKQGGDQGYTMSHTEYDRGNTVYHNEKVTEYICNTNWLDNDEILYLEDLWNSREVFIKVGDTWYPTIIDQNTTTINTDKRDLRQYQTSFIIANKKYN